MKKLPVRLLPSVLALALVACGGGTGIVAEAAPQESTSAEPLPAPSKPSPGLAVATAEDPVGDGFFDRLVAAGIERTRHRLRYDGSYHRLDYPGGDVPEHIGVCTDVVIRSYRAVGLDLQRLVHEDMKASFSSYPKLWNLPRPDPNIDHRRVPNLQTYFQRQGAELLIGDQPSDYRPGDLVTWMVSGNLPHIGIVTHLTAPSGRPLIAHNIGRGPQLEDMLFAYPITGHYRFGESEPRSTPGS